MSHGKQLSEILSRTGETLHNVPMLKLYTNKPYCCYR